MMYMTVLWAEEYRLTHEYDEEQLKRSCSAIEEKLPCHRYLVNCSEAVTGDHSIEERGYEALRNIMCDVKKLKETYIAAKCVNEEKIMECTRQLMPTSNPQDAEEPSDLTSRCNINPAEVDCFDQAFNSSCTLSMTTAKAVMTRVGHAAVLLRGCESSANAVVVSRSFLVLLVVPIVLSWLRT
nr:uncharacterized protein LOC119165568 isoform X1 [Rhipicephalus microplus]